MLRLPALVIVCLSLSGCYLLQVTSGQMQVLSKRQPITKIIADPQTAPALRTRLAYVSAARAFASRELGLPDNPSYRSYADLKRPFALWNVVAADEFSIEPRRWCFPIAGCVNYRGYFKESNAQRYARGLRRRGIDAAVGGVAAYSTLGHFNDPLLNTMLGWGDAQLAGTVFHELAHQLIYVPGDSEFNEAFATAVEEVGLQRWLAGAEHRKQMEDWKVQRERSQQFIDLLLATRERLRLLYRTHSEPGLLRSRKQEEFGRLKFEYAQLRVRWQNYPGYDAWFNRALSNAHLVSAATYHGCLPDFHRLLDSVGGDLPRFYAEVQRLANLTTAQRAREFCTESR